MAFHAKVRANVTVKFRDSGCGVGRFVVEMPLPSRDTKAVESEQAEAERLRREVDAVNARLPEGLIFGFGRLDDLEAED